MNVPKLRFKEFNDEYKTLKLSDVAELTSSKRIYLSDYTDNGIPFYRGKEISELKLNKPVSDLLYISDEKYKEIEAKYGVPKENDILVTGVGTLGNIYRIPNNIKFYFKDGNLIWLKNIKQNSEYLEYNLEFNKKKLLDSAIGSTQKALTIAGLNKLSFCYPSTSEQTKVARTMQLIDKKINLQSKKIEDLKLFKLYIRKKIFSSNTNNNIRLKEIINCESSNITLADIENDNGIYPVYGATGFIKNIKNYKFDSEYIAIVKDGAGVGRTMICPKNSSILATMNALTIKNNYPLNYICEMINTISFDKYIVGSGIPHIYFKDYGNEEFMLHNENDANKFDSVFKCLDRKIELLNVSLDKLNILKKGLMQGMFV